MGVVFAVTYFSIYTPTEQEQVKVEAKKERPVRFFTSTRAWNPVDPRDVEHATTLMDHAFPGFFEPDEQKTYGASFWFENRNSEPVEIQMARVSCNSCSSGQIAALPPEVTKNIMQMTAISMLPHGPITMLPIGMVSPAAHLNTPGILNWQLHEFTKPPAECVYTVPPAPTNDRWAMPWNILQINFSVKPGTTTKMLQTLFLIRIKGSEEVFPEEFRITFVGAPPFDLDKSQIVLGELTESSPRQEFEIIAFSSTRPKPPDLTVNVVMPPGVGGEPGPFINTGKPVPVPESELEPLMKRLTEARGKASTSRGEYPLVRVQSAIRIPVIVQNKVDGALLDIGPVERNIVFQVPGADPKIVEVRGKMRGSLSLAGNAREIGFGAFSYRTEQNATVTVETEKSGVELEIVKDLCQPKAMRVELTRQPDNGDRGVYKLKATIPANEQLGEIRDGVIVLSTKGPNPQRMRVPVTGRGRD